MRHAVRLTMVPSPGNSRGQNHPVEDDRLPRTLDVSAYSRTASISAQRPFSRPPQRFSDPVAVPFFFFFFLPFLLNEPAFCFSLPTRLTTPWGELGFDGLLFSLQLKPDDHLVKMVTKCRIRFAGRIVLT